MSAVMPEREVLTRMGDGGMDHAVEAVAELLISMGYHDVASELRRRYDDEPDYFDGCC